MGGPPGTQCGWLCAHLFDRSQKMAVLWCQVVSCKTHNSVVTRKYFPLAGYTWGWFKHLGIHLHEVNSQLCVQESNDLWRLSGWFHGSHQQYAFKGQTNREVTFCHGKAQDSWNHSFDCQLYKQLSSAKGSIPPPLCSSSPLSPDWGTASQGHGKPAASDKQ